MEKAVIKAGALMKNINNLVAAAASPDKVVSPACPQLLQLLLDLQQPPIAPLWLGEFHRQRLISEVTFLRSTFFLDVLRPYYDFDKYRMLLDQFSLKIILQNI